MFLTYLRRELTNRRKQTVIIAVGMALAIALVVIVSSIASGVQSAQSSVLQSVYGVGTDITVSKTETPSSSSTGRPSFDFGGQDSSDGSGSTDLSQSRLAVSRGASTLRLHGRRACHRHGRRRGGHRGPHAREQHVLRPGPAERGQRRQQRQRRPGRSAE